LKLQYDGLLLSFTFNFNFRRYNLEVLIWAREHDCPWGIGTCSWAAKNGHLAVLRWAREHGCPWNKRMCVSAASRHPKTLAWVKAQPY
jgi:hypothetical protein